MFQFSHILSVAALASVGMAAPQYFYLGLTPTFYSMGYNVPQQAAYGVILKLSLRYWLLDLQSTFQAPALGVPATAPATDQLAGLTSLAGLLPGLKALTAQATAQTPATLGALDQIQGATLNLLTKVPQETIPIEFKADIATLIAASQQLIALNQATKGDNRAELDKVIAASNNLLAALPAEGRPSY